MNNKVFPTADPDSQSDSGHFYSSHIWPSAHEVEEAEGILLVIIT